MTNQKTLLEFFEIIERADWQQHLRDVIKRKSLDIWDIDVSALAKAYLEDLEKTKDINKIAKGLLICSIILKYKSYRLKLKELENIIEEEITDAIEEVIEEEKNPLLVLEKTDEKEKKEIELEVLEKALDKLLDTKKPKKRKYKKITKKDFELIQYEDLEEHMQTLYKIIKTRKEIDFFDLQNQTNSKRSVLSTLLFLSKEEKVKLKQKKPYENVYISAR